ncbi:MAG: hypothetical protein HY056_04100, partial [Proteobacteria bacterium]|nr:hypothetical protein [Pseudomonadota bacterium]
ALLESELRQAVAQPEFAEKYLARDVAGVGNSSADTKAWIARETDRLAKVVKAAKMQVD